MAADISNYIDYWLYFWCFESLLDSLSPLLLQYNLISEDQATLLMFAFVLIGDLRIFMLVFFVENISRLAMSEQ